MHFVVIIPFFLLVLAAILAIAIISAIAEVITTLASVLFIFVCFVGGGILFFLGGYRLIRTVLLGLYQRVYASAYVIWVGVGLILPAWGIGSLAGAGFQQRVRDVTYESFLYFWTIEHESFRNEPNLWGYMMTAGLWITLAGVILFAVEWCRKNPERFRAGLRRVTHATGRGAKKFKRSIDGATHNRTGA